MLGGLASTLRLGDLRPLFVSEVDDLKVRLRMKGGGVDQQPDKRLLSVAVAEIGKGLELVEVRLTLYVEHLRERFSTESRSGEQLQEEVIAVSGLAHKRRREPYLELATTGVRQPVENPVRSAGLFDTRCGDQAVTDEPIEHLVEVTDVEAAPLWPDSRFELGPEDIAITLSSGEQSEHGVLDGHEEILSRTRVGLDR